MRSGEEGLTSFNKNNRANFPVKKKCDKSFRRVYFVEITRKN